ncbi:MAG TPA: hypothetical protein DEF79_10165 [Gammaproteobacteria bacterium]|nr:hypothetical protein [Gammaproteobacteria bacterium]
MYLEATGALTSDLCKVSSSQIISQDSLNYPARRLLLNLLILYVALVATVQVLSLPLRALSATIVSNGVLSALNDSCCLYEFIFL